MRRLLPTLAITLLAAASCSDQSVLPTSSLAPSGALKDVGDPPPPPVAGDGFAFLSPALDDSEDACSISDSFSFSYKYFVNKPAHNAHLQMDITAPGHDGEVSGHETDKKIDAKGTLSGPGYTFVIKQTLGGSLMGSETRLVSTAFFQLVGELTTEAGKCTANLNLTAQLTSEDVFVPN